MATNLTHTSKQQLILFSLSVGLLVLGFWGGLAELVNSWMNREEYSHGFFIPLISGWLLWNRRDAIVKSTGKSSLLGLPVILASLIILVIGELTAIYILTQGAFILSLMGLVLTFGGFSLLRVCFLPLAYLVFAIPTPYFIDAQLSWGLQLISSSLGVDMLRLMGVSVYLEGNVIDLGLYKLQVVEACSGLRYLYPLMSLGFLAAYLFSAPIWQRGLIFLSTIPITIFMNSFRIAVIGLLVNTWGNEMAEGFLHFFEGWIIFMSCAVILLLEVWVLDRLGKRRKIANLLEVPEIKPVTPSGSTPVKGPMVVATAIAALVGISVTIIDEREEILPDRKILSGFPLEVGRGEWLGRESFLEPNVENVLDVDDYLLADYRSRSGEEVNFYVAYYESQRKGSSPHSPRVCIPGGGWLITDLSTVDYTTETGETFPIVRAELELNSQKLLVYYWFEQRGRRIANEYLAKWYLLVDSLLMNRTDGALVRVTTPIYPHEDMAHADERIMGFVADALPDLGSYIPE